MENQVNNEGPQEEDRYRISYQLVYRYLLKDRRGPIPRLLVVIRLIAFIFILFWPIRCAIDALIHGFVEHIPDNFLTSVIVHSFFVILIDGQVFDMVDLPIIGGILLQRPRIAPRDLVFFLLIVVLPVGVAMLAVAPVFGRDAGA